MKKRWLSLFMLLSFGTGFISGCKGSDEKVVEKLTVDGSDVVLKVGNKNYTADELFADMLNSGAGAQEAYEKILRMVVEDAISVDSNMEASWELLLDSFEETVKNNALSNGISEEEARNKLLNEEGYSSIEEKKEEYYYSVKLDKLQDKYWEDNKQSFYNDYFNERLPYYVKHVLVKTPYTSARGGYSTIIESSDAKALFNVYDWLVKGYDFTQIMNEYSEDTGSSDTGIGYHMDMTTSFVSEFLHGVFVFDAMLKGRTEDVYGITEAAALYAGATSDAYNFGVINASDIEVMGKNASESDIKSITMYEKVKNENQVEEEKSAGTISTAYGSSYSLYARSIIFNQTFNNPGISVIKYDANRDGVNAPTKKININGQEIDVLTDENGNIVFVVCARGSSSDLWIHFLTVNVSPFDTYENTSGERDARIFFSIDKDATIKEMVAEYKTELEEAGDKTAEQIKTLSDEYKADLQKVRTYVDEKVKNNDTLAKRNEVIDELEGYVKSYAKRGITSGAVAGQDQFLTYMMLKELIEEGDNAITIKEDIKSLVETYLKSQLELIELSTENEIMNGWNSYVDLVKLAHLNEINDRKIPMECSYVVNGNNNRGSLCKYVYGEGFKILMRYMDGSKEITDIGDEYKSYVLGQDFNLPVLKDTATHKFDGWYEDDKLTIKASLDTKRTSTNNKTQLYAKWIEISNDVED